jgi:histidinol-phosphate aminotransferase
MAEVSRRGLIGASMLGAAMAGTASRGLARAPEASLPRFGPAPGKAHLIFNENPYGPSPAALRAIAETASAGCYYVDELVPELVARIAARYRVAPEQVLIGNGSFELLVAAARAWASKGAILSPDLMFDEPIRRAEGVGVRRATVPLAADMGIDLAALAGRVGPDIGLVYLCNPNNPTGMLLDGDALRGFARALPAGHTLLVDEAYCELTDDPARASVIDLVREGRDVIVTRTFSKIFGLAGLRVGYAISTPDNIARMKAESGTIGPASAGLAAALASFDDDAFMRYSLARIREGRAMIVDAAGKAGLRVLPSQTNFVFVEVPDADAMRDAMAARGIAIRGAYGKWTRWSRVSTGRIEHVRRYAEALPAVLRG